MKKSVILTTLLVLVENGFTTNSFIPDRHNQINFSQILSVFNGVLYESVILFLKSMFCLMINSNTELIHFRVIGNKLSSSARWI